MLQNSSIFGRKLGDRDREPSDHSENPPEQLPRALLD
jgi:hypothetical protein